MPVRKRTDGSWLIDFRYEDPSTGKSTRFKRSARLTARKLGLPEPTGKREVEKLERKVRQALESRGCQGPERPKAQEKNAPFGNFAGHWIERKKLELSPATTRNYRKSMKHHAVPFFKDMRVRDIGVDDVEAYKLSLIESGIVPTSANTHIRVLSTLLSSAVAWGYASDNPAKKVKPIREPKKEYTFWDRAASDRFLAKCLEVSPEWHAFFLTALRTGLRLGELTGLHWADVDFAKQVIHVRNNLVLGEFKAPKSGKARHLPMTPDLVRELAERQRSRPNGRLVFSRFVGGEEAPLCRTVPGRKLVAVAKKAGVKPIRIHDLRHSFASQLVIAGVPLVAVQRLLGHSTIDMTLRYAHLGPQVSREAVLTLVGDPDSSWARSGPEGEERPERTAAK